MRLFDISSIDQSISISKVKIKEDPKIILYSRVSSSKQQDDLKRQQEYLRNNLSDKYPGSGYVEVSDIGSGINFKRPGLLRVLGSVKKGDVSTLVVASKDRLARFGFELIEWLCTEFGTKIVVLDSEDTTPEAELGKDLMAIVQVYCCRWNGMRRYQAKKNCEGVQIETETEQGTKGTTELLGRMLEVSLQQDDSDVDESEKQNTQREVKASKQVCDTPKKRVRKPKQLLL
jgi:putative resolvase